MFLYGNVSVNMSLTVSVLYPWLCLSYVHECVCLVSAPVRGACPWLCLSVCLRIRLSYVHECVCLMSMNVPVLCPWLCLMSVNVSVFSPWMCLSCMCSMYQWICLVTVNVSVLCPWMCLSYITDCVCLSLWVCVLGSIRSIDSWWYTIKIRKNKNSKIAD